MPRSPSVLCTWHLTVRVSPASVPWPRSDALSAPMRLARACGARGLDPSKTSAVCRCVENRHGSRSRAFRALVHILVSRYVSFRLLSSVLSKTRFLWQLLVDSLAIGRAGRPVLGLANRGLWLTRPRVMSDELFEMCFETIIRVLGCDDSRGCAFVLASVSRCGVGA